MISRGNTPDVPNLIAVILTKSFLDDDIFSVVRNRIEQTTTPFRMLDWGSWVVPATTTEILLLMAQWTIGGDLQTPRNETDKPRLKRAGCKEVVMALPPDGAYVLVIEEY